jgi:hypothetical protein
MAATKPSLVATEPTPLERLHHERASLARELAEQNRTASRLQEAATSEASALAELAALSDQDTAAMKRWASTGCAGNPPEPDAKQRRALGEKLSSAQAAATAAKGAGADIDQKIAQLNERLRVIGAQIEQAIFDKMETEHTFIIDQYRAICEQGSKLAAQIHGLASFFGDAGRTLIGQGQQDAGTKYLQRASALTNIKLPNPGVTRHEIEAAAHEWSRRAATLRAAK